MRAATRRKPTASRPTPRHEPIGAYLEFAELECELEFACLTGESADGPIADAIRSRMEVVWSRLTPEERRSLIEGKPSVAMADQERRCSVPPWEG